MNVPENIHYAPLCNCEITVLYMPDQRLTENWRTEQSLATLEPNPTGRRMGPSDLSPRLGLYVRELGMG